MFERLRSWGKRVEGDWSIYIGIFWVLYSLCSDPAEWPIMIFVVFGLGSIVYGIGRLLHFFGTPVTASCRDRIPLAVVYVVLIGVTLYLCLFYV